MGTLVFDSDVVSSIAAAVSSLTSVVIAVLTYVNWRNMKRAERESERNMNQLKRILISNAAAVLASGNYGGDPKTAIRQYGQQIQALHKEHLFSIEFGDE